MNNYYTRDVHGSTNSNGAQKGAQKGVLDSGVSEGASGLNWSHPEAVKLLERKLLDGALLFTGRSNKMPGEQDILEQNPFGCFTRYLFTVSGIESYKRQYVRVASG
nr:hypothetical protein [Candidatus Sigynarchaeota archaeon]